MKAWLEADGCANHEPSDWIVDTAPTCLPGERHKECTVCGAVLETEALDPTEPHEPSDWIVDVEATATTPGEKHKECTVCGEILENEEIPVASKITVGAVEGCEGDLVTVTLDIANNPGIFGAMLTLEYDSALTLVDVAAGDAWRALTLTKPANFASPCNFVWDGASNPDYTDGSVIVLTFRVPDYAEVGTVYEISASYTPGNLIDANLEPIDIAIESGSITVVKRMGDVNNDRVVDVSDVVALRRYLAGGYGVEINEELADMNEDGEINVADVVLLRRFLVV